MRQTLLALFALLLHAHAVTELPKLLQTSIPIKDLDSTAENDVVYRLVVPNGATTLEVSTSAGSGDADIFARRGAHPTVDDYDGKSDSFGNVEKITLSAPTGGVWFVLLHTSSSFHGVRLETKITLPANVVAVPQFSPGPGTFNGKIKVTLRSPVRTAILRYTTDGSDPTSTSPRYRAPLVLAATTPVKARAFLGSSGSPVVEGSYTLEAAGTVSALQSGIAAIHRSGNVGSMALFKITIPSGPARRLHIETASGTGDTTLYIRRAAPPTAKTYDKRINGKRNLAVFEQNESAAGDWFIGVRGLGDFSGVTVFASEVLPVPDLVAWQDTLQPYISTETFDPTDCTVLEGHVVAGERRLLRFSTESRNIGGADLVIGDPTSNPNFEYHPCHGHYHFLGFARYRLLNAQGGIAALGRKISFCLEDIHQWDSKAAQDSKFSCDYQGIQAGWSDIYDSGLEGQWVDITGVAAGSYTLEVTMNPDHILLESDYTNNVTTIPVTIPAP